ncbi:MAG TPA: hypothetical protein VKA81_06515, partial [Verrucomicrobiae bacterium]|nr:hypothetical protein [Verrucomicrobiae bacterium]
RRPSESGGQRKKEEANATADEYRLLEEFRALLAQTKRKLGWFRISPLPLLFSLLPLWLFVPLLLVGHIAAVPLSSRFGGRVFTWPQAAISFVACLGGVLALHWLGRLMAGASARRLAAALGRARARLDACRETAEANHQKESERIRREAEARSDQLQQHWNQAVNEAETMRNDLQRHLDAKLSRATARNDQLLQHGLERL